MPARLTEKEFSKHVNTKFRAQLLPDTHTDLELVEVKGYAKKLEEHRGMERFSAYFAGPKEPHLPQAIYSFQHDEMGSFEMFLVPVALDDRGYRYEAVFNYFKDGEG